MKVHVVEQGDWLGAIATRYGVADAMALWEHSANTELREIRGSPDFLMVGDEVRIPADVRTSGVDVPVDRRAVFVARRPTNRVQLRVAGVRPLLDAFGPIAFELRVGREVVTGEIRHPNQILEAPLSPDADRAVLTLAGKQRYEFAVGGLGPAHEPAGAYARLVNLGFAQAQASTAPGLEGASGSEGATDPLASALGAFQRSHDLPVTGELDEATVAALEGRYGA